MLCKLAKNSFVLMMLLALTGGRAHVATRLSGVNLPVEQSEDAMLTQPAGPAPPFVEWPKAGPVPAEIILRVAPDPSQGFHFPYLLILPQGVASPVSLLIEPNNDGESDVPSGTHLYWALDLAAYRFRTTGKSLGSALLVPVFPRFSNRFGGQELYTHALSRTALTTRIATLARPDQQLLAMIEDAHRRLTSHGVAMRPKVLLNGFSASGNFVLRWAMIHPKAVCAVAAGGFAGLPTLPFDRLQGRKLDYPLGTADWEQMFGMPFDAEAHRQIPHLYYLGAGDRNDAIGSRDSYSRAQQETVRRTLGMDPQGRFRKVERLLHEAGYTKDQFMTPLGMDHAVSAEMEASIGAFMAKQISSGACDRAG